MKYEVCRRNTIGAYRRIYYLLYTGQRGYCWRSMRETIQAVVWWWLEGIVEGWPLVENYHSFFCVVLEYLILLWNACCHLMMMQWCLLHVLLFITLIRYRFMMYYTLLWKCSVTWNFWVIGILYGGWCSIYCVGLVPILVSVCWGSLLISWERELEHSVLLWVLHLWRIWEVVLITYYYVEKYMILHY